MEVVNVILTELALIDLQDIESYIAKDSQAIARKFISRIFEKIEQLKIFPLLGKPLSEISDTSFRELMLNKYRIVYQLKHNTVYIIRIVHGARLVDLNL